ncbi:MAG TPA: hypothetical protein VIY08_02990 [Candidatus Nitrosocosmicus sp.]
MNKNNSFLSDICDFKYLDLSVPIGRCSLVPMHNIYDNIVLEYGCTYNFTVLHESNNPLTKNSVPFYPIKISMVKHYLDYDDYDDIKDLTRYTYKINNVE